MNKQVSRRAGSRRGAVSGDIPSPSISFDVVFTCLLIFLPCCFIYFISFGMYFHVTYCRLCHCMPLHVPVIHLTLLFKHVRLFHTLSIFCILFKAFLSLHYISISSLVVVPQLYLCTHPHMHNLNWFYIVRHIISCSLNSHPFVILYEALLFRLSSMKP